RPEWWFWRCADHMLGPAFALARLHGVRRVFSAAVDPDVEPRRALYQRPRMWPLYAWGLSWSDRIFVQHHDQLARLPRAWRRKAALLPNLIAPLPPMKPHALRRGHVAWMGQLRQVKRPDLLLEIAQMAPSVSFVVCGGPTQFLSPPGYGARM